MIRSYPGSAAVLALVILAAGCEQPQPDGMKTPATTAPDTTTGNGTQPAADTGANPDSAISADYMRGIIARISDDEFGGRAPGSDGDMTARSYLAGQLEQLGFLPGAEDGGWQQPFALLGITSGVPKSWVFQAGKARLELGYWEEFIAASGVQRETAGFGQAEVVFVGYGIEAPEYGWDDFKGTDLKGKVLLMLNNDPDWSPDLFAGDTRLYYGRWSYKYESAARQGAAGAIIIHTRESAGYPFQVVQTSWSGEQFELPDTGEPRIQVAAWVTQQAARELAELGGHDLDDLVDAARSRDFRPVALGVTTSLALTNTIKQTASANVLGVLPGSDPDLRNEVVIYTAHHDHLGTGVADDAGDTIYNGARDNGSGMAMVFAIARAFKSLPAAPRRSILVAFVGGEESGLLGSEYYAARPTFPPGRIAANINYDSGNIWGRTRDLTVIGLGKSSLDGYVIDYAARQSRSVKPDQFPDRGYFYRSDQFNLARIGVPAMYLRNGTDFIGRPDGWGREQVEFYEDHHYHQPSDELRDDWNFDGMVEDAVLGFRVGLAIANADEMPAWTPGDEFEAARLAALAALP